MCIVLLLKIDTWNSHERDISQSWKYSCHAHFIGPLFWFSKLIFKIKDSENKQRLQLERSFIVFCEILPFGGLKMIITDV